MGVSTRCNDKYHDRCLYIEANGGFCGSQQDEPFKANFRINNRSFRSVETYSKPEPGYRSHFVIVEMDPDNVRFRLLCPSPAIPRVVVAPEVLEPSKNTPPGHVRCHAGKTGKGKEKKERENFLFQVRGDPQAEERAV